MWNQGGEMSSFQTGHNRRNRNDESRGFSLFELLIAVVVILALAGMAIPVTLSTINNVKLRSEAVDFVGLVQSARIQAVKKNTFYTIVPNSSTGNDIAYFVDYQGDGNYQPGEPVVQWRSVTVFAGTGSGAPDETAFVANLGFGVNAGFPVMDARGLPCVPNNSSHTCPEVAGTGFIIFFSIPNTFAGANWAALVVTPSGRAQTWSYDGTNWFQQ